MQDITMAVPSNTMPNESICTDEKILVPTIRCRPLRMRQIHKDDSKMSPSTAETSLSSKNIEPFMYYSLSTNRIKGMRYLIEEAGNDKEVIERTQFPVEDYPYLDLMMLEDDI